MNTFFYVWVFGIVFFMLAACVSGIYEMIQFNRGKSTSQFFWVCVVGISVPWVIIGYVVLMIAIAFGWTIPSPNGGA